MGRPAGAKNKRTLVREQRIKEAAEGAAKTAAKTDDPRLILDSLALMEAGMRYFYGQHLAALEDEKPDRDRSEATLLNAVSIAEKVAPYQHHRLSAMKLSHDPVDPKMGEATADQLKREIMTELAALGLGPMPVGVANRNRPASQNN